MDDTSSPLWAHQREILERHRDKPYFALFLDTGTGKTRTTIELMRYKYSRQGQVLKTLIFCPQIVCHNWKREIQKYSQIDPDQVLLLGSGSAQRRKDLFLEKVAQFPGFISIANYEALRMPDLFSEFKRWAPELLVWDEAHRLKDHKAQRSQLADELSNPWDKKLKAALPKPATYILTGSPVLNSPEDLFMPYKIMDGGKTFGDNPFSFKRTYFVNRNAHAPSHVTWPKWEIKTFPKDGMDAMATIKQKISTTSVSIRKEDCLDLPPLVRQTISVGLSPSQKKHYEEMKRDFVTYTQDAACVATLAITKALRMQQIVSGYLPVNFNTTEFSHTHGESVVFDENPRMDALEELLSDLTPHHKVLVWAVWRENYRQIRNCLDKLKVKFVEVHGDIPNAQKFKNVDAFNDDPSVRVFLGHPGAGGIGINLVSASYSIFYSRTASLEQSIQAEARNFRHGSQIHPKVTRIDLVAENTIDELICTSLANKEEISLSILRANLNKI